MSSAVSLRAIVLSTLGWRAAFVVGAVLTVLVLLFVLAALPESIDFLLVKRPDHALETINRTLSKMKQPTISVLPDAVPRVKNEIRTEVFKGRNGGRTALLSFGFFVMMAGFYFANGWTPRLLLQSGMTAQQGTSAGILLNLGGAAAALLFALLAVFFRNKVLTVIAFVGAAAAFASMGIWFGGVAQTLTIALFVGALIQACATGLFTLSPETFPTAVRTTGVGVAVTAGRIGAIISPILGRGPDRSRMDGAVAVHVVRGASRAGRGRGRFPPSGPSGFIGRDRGRGRKLGAHVGAHRFGPLI